MIGVVHFLVAWLVSICIPLGAFGLLLANDDRMEKQAERKRAHKHYVESLPDMDAVAQRERYKTAIALGADKFAATMYAQGDMVISSVLYAHELDAIDRVRAAIGSDKS